MNMPSGRSNVSCVGSGGALLDGAVNRAGLVMVLLILFGCEPQLEGKDRFCPPDFNVIEDLFKPRCTQASCHAAGVHPAGGLDLQSSGVTARLIGVPATCGGVRVDPNDPDHSLLLEKVAGQPVCGGRMPLGGQPLTEGEVSCLREWMETVTATAGSSGPDGGQ